MRASNFRQFKKSLQQHINDFSVEADRNVSDDEWEMPIHRHCAAEILVWILNRTGATLRQSQLVEAWRSIVRTCWNLMDCTTFAKQNSKNILGEIEYFKAKSARKNAEKILEQNNQQNYSELQPTLRTHGVIRTHRVRVTA